MVAMNPSRTATPVATVMVDGYPAFLWPDGRLRPIVSGGEGPTGSGQPGSAAGAGGQPGGEGGDAGGDAGGQQPAGQPGQAATPPPPPAAQQQGGASTPPPPDLTGLQQALDHATTTGQTEALRPLMEAAGVTDAEGLQAFITGAREQRDAQLSEEQRRIQELEQANTQHAEQLATARRNARDAMVRASLVAAGMAGDRASDRVGWVAVADDADQAVVDTAVATFREANPELFAQAPGAPHSTVTPPGQQTVTDELAEARERGQRHREQRTGTQDPWANFQTVGQST